MARPNTNKPSDSSISASKDQLTEMIRKKAYELYEKNGRKAGRDMDNWLEAERIVKRRAF